MVKNSSECVICEAAKDQLGEIGTRGNFGRAGVVEMNRGTSMLQRQSAKSKTVLDPRWNFHLGKIGGRKENMFVPSGVNLSAGKTNGSPTESSSRCGSSNRGYAR